MFVIKSTYVHTDDTAIKISDIESPRRLTLQRGDNIVKKKLKFTDMAQWIE